MDALEVDKETPESAATVINQRLTKKSADGDAEVGGYADGGSGAPEGFKSKHMQKG